jgi:5-formyltetrahydrofolate cyclo-ligase
MAACLADDKKYFRQILRESRIALPEARANAISQAVERRLLESRYYRDSSSVVLYASTENEIQTGGILTDALASGRRVIFPKVVPGSRDLSLVRVNDRAEFRPGAYGLLEPAGAEMVRPSDLGWSLICVPGVAFSLAGQRLGRGGGYYDRFLAGVGSQAITAGLAYSFQVLDRLPESPHDRRLDLIVTESALYVAGNAPRPAAVRTDQGGVPKCCC